MELYGYYCTDETALLASVLTFIWLHFLWETYLKYRQVKLLISRTIAEIGCKSRFRSSYREGTISFKCFSGLFIKATESYGIICYVSRPKTRVCKYHAIAVSSCFRSTYIGLSTIRSRIWVSADNQRSSAPATTHVSRTSKSKKRTAAPPPLYCIAQLCGYKLAAVYIIMCLQKCLYLGLYFDSDTNLITIPTNAVVERKGVWKKFAIFDQSLALSPKRCKL